MPPVAVGIGIAAAIGVVGIAASHGDVAGNFLWKLGAPKKGNWIPELPRPPRESSVSSFVLDPKKAAVHVKNARRYP